MTVLVPKFVTKELTAVDFRQCYTPEPAHEVAGQSRHWLLDSAAGRDLLKCKLLKLNPHANVALFSHDKEADGLLNQMIDELDLRAMVKPETQLEVLKVNFKLVKMFFAVQFGLRV
jgi:hypothetical protein